MIQVWDYYVGGGGECGAGGETYIDCMSEWLYVKFGLVKMAQTKMAPYKNNSITNYHKDF
jgi:hypothetical protein